MSELPFTKEQLQEDLQYLVDQKSSSVITIDLTAERYGISRDIKYAFFSGKLSRDGDCIAIININGSSREIQNIKKHGGKTGSSEQYINDLVEYVHDLAQQHNFSGLVKINGGLFKIRDFGYEFVNI